MDNISLKQVYWGGVTVQVPEIWDVDTEELVEADGGKSFCIGISACGNDLRSIDISYGPLPKGSNAYAEACGTYEEVIDEDALQANDGPILTFDFQGKAACGFSLTTDSGLPCFFFCTDIPSAEKNRLLTVLVSAKDNDELQSLLDFVEEYLSVE